MIIVLSGYARSGKDEIAKVLVEEHGYIRVAFADKIREFLYELNPQVGSTRLAPLVSEYGWDVAKSSPEVRYLLQTLGVSARKLFGDKFWVHQALGSMALAHPKIVITDVRFTNEADTIKTNGGQIWRVTRPGIEAVNSHISEHDLDKYVFDLVIDNDLTLESLKEKVMKAVASI